MPHSSRYLAPQCPAVGACVFTDPNTAVFFIKMATMGTICYIISALAAYITGDVSTKHSMLLVVPLAVLPGPGFPNLIYRALAKLILPSAVYDTVQERGVLSGARPERGVCTLGCPAHASLRIL